MSADKDVGKVRRMMVENQTVKIAFRAASGERQLVFAYDGPVGTCAGRETAQRQPAPIPLSPISHALKTPLQFGRFVTD